MVPKDTYFLNAPLLGTCTATTARSTESTLPGTVTNQQGQDQRVVVVGVPKEGKGSPAIRSDLGVKVSFKGFEAKILKEIEQENFERERGKLEQCLIKEKAKRDVNALLQRKALYKIKNKFCCIHFLKFRKENFKEQYKKFLNF